MASGNVNIHDDSSDEDSKDEEKQGHKPTSHKKGVTCSIFDSLGAFDLAYQRAPSSTTGCIFPTVT